MSDSRSFKTVVALAFPKSLMRWMVLKLTLVVILGALLRLALMIILGALLRLALVISRRKSRRRTAAGKI